MKKLIVIIIVLVVVIGGILVFVRNSASPATDYTASPTSAPSESINPGNTNPTPVTAPTPTGGTSTPGAYTLADVAKHASGSSCWTAINGNVYDLTTWISEHPGGPQRILSICGIDGSSAFNAQHGGDPRVASILASMKIGTLAR